MSPKDIAKIIKYWFDLSKRDQDVAGSLFRTGKYDYCLFLCHFSLEKILKALVTKTSKDHPPYTHNLLYLAGKGNIELTKKQIETLNEINGFNMEIRYPDDLKQLHKRIDKDYAKKYFNISREYWKWFQKLLEK